MATSFSQHCQLIGTAGILNNAPSSFPVLEISSILDNILCTFVSNYVELLAAVECLKDVLANNPKVGNPWRILWILIYLNKYYLQIRLIVIDSFSFLLRHDIDTLDRVRILYQLLADLDALAVDHKCAVSKILLYSIFESILFCLYKELHRSYAQTKFKILYILLL